MSLVFDSFLRAVAYCLHPRIIVLTLLPLLLLLLIAGGIGYFYWDTAVDTVVRWIGATAVLHRIGTWLQQFGFAALGDALAPLLVVVVVTPVLVFMVLLFVAVLMMPAVVRLVGRNRFAGLEQKKGASFLRSALWSAGSVLLALVAMVVSLPLWLIPPLILVLPPLIWGWLTYRVMAFDALADHASSEERGLVLRRHRLTLLAMGVITGYLGAAPSVVWASGWLFAAALPVLLPLALWIYTLVFAFSALWFAHFCLAALAQLRAQQPMAAPGSPLALEG